MFKSSMDQQRVAASYDYDEAEHAAEIASAAAARAMETERRQLAGLGQGPLAGLGLSEQASAHRRAAARPEQRLHVCDASAPVVDHPNTNLNGAARGACMPRPVSLPPSGPGRPHTPHSPTRLNKAYRRYLCTSH